MEIILKEDLQGLGHKNDVVRVRPGYGRNYLIPKGLAMVANAVNKKIALENIRQSAHKMAKLREDAEALATQLDQVVIKIEAKAGEKGQIFGSITSSQLVEALREHRIIIDPKHISFQKPIKTLGEHEASIWLHKEVTYTLRFCVKKMGDELSTYKPHA